MRFFTKLSSHLLAQDSQNWLAIVTVRNSNCRKVMFSQACVKNSVHGGGVYQHALGQTPMPLVRHPHTPAQCMLGYTPPGGHSYWNAYLLSYATGTKPIGKWLRSYVPE